MLVRDVVIPKPKPSHKLCPKSTPHTTSNQCPQWKSDKMKLLKPVRMHNKKLLIFECIIDGLYFPTIQCTKTMEELFTAGKKLSTQCGWW